MRSLTPLFLTACAFALAGCRASPDPPPPVDAPATAEASSDSVPLAARAGIPIDPGAAVTRVAFGSCNRTTLPQPIWDPVLAAEPQLWIWLGDNVYGDTDDMAVMRSKYEAQLASSGYRSLLASARIVGTWDDHDFGENNAGNEYPMRAESQQVALDFLGVPVDDPRRSREGLYSSHTWGPEGRRVKVILLDSRYHRDARGSDGAVLGEAQWSWLEAELRDSDAQIHLIGNGIQVLPEDHRYEKWANFPTERRRLLDLIGQTGAPGVILLSGDRHLAEISRIEDAAVGYPIHEVTASGMTHSFTGGGGETNHHRVGENFTRLNFGFAEIDWTSGEVALQIRDVEGATARRVAIPFGLLGLPAATTPGA